MRQDGEVHAQEDLERKAEFETRNAAEHSVHRSERLLRDRREKLTEAQRSAIETGLAAVKDALAGKDSRAIETAARKLDEAWEAASRALRDAGAKAEPAGSTSRDTGTGPDLDAGAPGDGLQDRPIIDAEVVEERKSA